MKPTNWLELGRGIRQDCCLSQSLFNLYIKDMLSDILEDKERLSIGRKVKYQICQLSGHHISYPYW